MLEAAAILSQCCAYAEGMWRNLQVQWVMYINYSTYVNLVAIPAPEDTLVMYAQYLNAKVKLADTNQQYINGVKTLHTLCQMQVKQFQGFRLNLPV